MASRQTSAHRAMQDRVMDDLQHRFDAATSCEDNYVMVASIDFGTTYSGYAFSFKTQQDEIRMNKNWGDGVGHQSFKTPTSVLVDANGACVGFGFEAETKYSQMILEKKKCELYRHFKMTLHNQQHLRRTTRVQSVSGKSEDAMVIFTHAVAYLKDHLLDAVAKTQTSKSQLDLDLIRWVITVPAIWSEESKRFMREVAHRAKLIDRVDSKRFMICLEPEAASIFCRQLPMDQFTTGRLTGVAPMLGVPGQKYMIVDAGGGTIDITAHEMQPKGTVKELLAATGGAWGGTRVDDNFVALLQRVFGRNFIDQLSRENPVEWFELRVAFETRKRAAKPSGVGERASSIRGSGSGSESGTAPSLVLPLGYSFCEKYQSVCGESIKQGVESANVDGVKFDNGYLILDPDMVKSLFDPVTSQIVDHIKQELRNPKAAGIKLILLVGGFGECAFLREALKNGLKQHGIKIICPSDAAISIIKGAVLFGHSPTIVSSRIARKTYGTDALLPFDPSMHPENRMIRTDQGVLYKGFDLFVRRGQEVKVNEEKTFTDMPSFADQKVMTYEFYSTDKESVQYPDESGVDRIGQMFVAIPDTKGGLNRKVQMKVFFGATEIAVEAQEKKADGSRGKKAEARLDFRVE